MKITREPYWTNLDRLDGVTEEDEDRYKVVLDCECPACHEKRADFLVWQVENTVRCESCGYYYVPKEEK